MTDATDTPRTPMEGLAEWLRTQRGIALTGALQRKLEEWASEVESTRCSPLVGVRMLTTEEVNDAHSSHAGYARMSTTHLEMRWPFFYEFCARLQHKFIEVNALAASPAKPPPPEDAIPTPDREAVAKSLYEKSMHYNDFAPWATLNEKNRKPWLKLADSSAAPAPREQKSDEKPFWHAVVSKRAPVINKAIKREDAADDYAQQCRNEGYTDADVIPLYTRPMSDKGPKA